MNFKQLFSIPNLLCYFRIGMIPVFAYTYLQAETSANYLLSALILGIMEFTDFLDGFIARKYHMVTEAGKIIDPIADKLLQLTLLLLIVIRNPFAAVVLILFLIKEASMAVCGLVSIKRKCRLDGALWCGKVSTAVFYICMALLILFPGTDHTVANILLCITAAFLLYSFIIYMKTYYHMLKKEKDSLPDHP